MNINATSATELDAILSVHRSAFGDEGNVIASLVEDLLQDPTAQPVISLSAKQDNQVVGHVLFTQAKVQQMPVMLLAPLAVLPENQNQGIGSALVKAGLQAATDAGAGLVFVLGRPSYYPQFGFTPAGVQGFEPSYPISKKKEDAWMVLELKADSINSVSGKVQCAKAIDKPEYWQE